VNISVTQNGKLLIKAPKSISDSEIISIINKNDKKIIKIQQHYHQIQSNKAKLQENQEIWFLGKIYQLKFVKRQTTPIFNGDYVLYTPQKDKDWKEVFIIFLKKEAERIFKQRLLLYSKLMNLEYSRFRLSNAKRSWGTCNSNKVISLSWRLIMAPLPVIDSVVVHELAHLIHPNHSKDFWKTVKTYMPNYDQSKMWLKKHTAKLQMFDF